MRWFWAGVSAVRWVAAVVTAVLGMCAGAAAPSAGVAQPQTSLVGELQSLASRASVVFAGQVVSIERRGDVVEVGFRVDQSVLGAAGAHYTLREWAGLWPPGQFRYTVGERALIFVHRTSAAGFASPVDGAEGVVPLIVQGADAPPLLDVRRLASALLRAPGTPLPTEQQGAISLADAVAVISSVGSPSPSGTGRPQEPVRLPLPVRGAPVNAPVRLAPPFVSPVSLPRGIAMPSAPVVRLDPAAQPVRSAAAGRSEVVDALR